MTIPHKQLYALNHLTAHLITAELWEKALALLTDVQFLEAKVGAGLVFALADDFSRANTSIPHNVGICKMTPLLAEAIRRDIHFIARRPSALFQCLWNTCWWYDCPEAAERYRIRAQDREEKRLPWDREELQLHKLLERWRKEKRECDSRSFWMRSLRPPPLPLGSQEDVALPTSGVGVSHVAFLGQSQCVVSVSLHGAIEVWDANSAKRLRYCDSPGQVVGLGVRASGRELVWAVANGEIYTWRWRTDRTPVLGGQCDETLELVRFSPDGTIAACVSKEPTRLYTWDILKNRLAKGLPEISDHVYDMTYSPDGRFFAAQVSGHEIWCVDTSTSRLMWRSSQCSIHPECLLRGIVFSCDSSRIGCAASCGVHILDAETGREHPHPFHAGNARCPVCIAFSPAGGHLALGYDSPASLGWLPDFSVRILNMETGREEACCEGHQGGVKCLAFSSDGRRIGSGSYDRTVRVWNPHAKQCDARRVDGVAPEHAVFSANGAYLACASSGSYVDCWDTHSGDKIASFKHCARGKAIASRFDTVTCMALSHDSCLLATGSAGGDIRVWDVSGKRQMCCLRGHTGSILQILFTEDSTRLVSQSFDNTVRIWSLRDCRHVARFGTRRDRAISCATSHGTARVAIACENGRLVTAGCVDGHTDGCIDDSGTANAELVFSPTDRHIARWSLSGDHHMHVWDIGVGRKLVDTPISGFAARSSAFSQDGRWMVWKNLDCSVCVWDLVLNKEHLRLNERASPASLMFAARDPRVLFGWDADTPLWAWNVATRERIDDVASVMGDLRDRDTGRAVRFCVAERESGLAVRPVHLRREIAWYPQRGVILDTHPSGMMWAMRINGELEVLGLEAASL